MDPQRRSAIHQAMVVLSDGDRSAFPVLVDHLWPVLLAFAQRALGHRQDAEDVAQEVFLRICARLADFDRTRDGLAWALGIAHFEVLTLRRRRQRRREDLDGPPLDRHASPTPAAEEALVERDLAAALTEALGALCPEDRVALGLSDSSSARTIPGNGPALRKRRQRALARLRSVWRRLHGEP